MKKKLDSFVRLETSNRPIYQQQKFIFKFLDKNRECRSTSKIFLSRSWQREKVSGVPPSFPTSTAFPLLHVTAASRTARMKTARPFLPLLARYSRKQPERNVLRLCGGFLSSAVDDFDGRTTKKARRERETERERAWQRGYIGPH